MSYTRGDEQNTCMEALNGSFDYDLQAAPDQAQLIVSDVSGRELKRIPLTSMQGQSLWDTRQVSPGTYAIELVNSGVNLASTLLVVKP